MSRDRTGEESDELRIVREHARLFGDGDVEGALGMVHPRAEFVLPDPIAPEGRIYSGHEGFRAGILRWIGDWGRVLAKRRSVYRRWPR